MNLNLAIGLESEDCRSSVGQEHSKCNSVIQTFSFLLVRSIMINFTTITMYYILLSISLLKYRYV